MLFFLQMNGSVGSRIEDSLLTVFCLLLPDEEWGGEGELVPLVFGKLQENREAIEMMEGDGRASEEHVQLRKALRIVNEIYKEIYPYLFLGERFACKACKCFTW